MTTSSWIVLILIALAVVALAVSWVRGGRTKRQLAAGQRSDGSGIIDPRDAAAGRSAVAQGQEDAGRHWRPMPPTGPGIR